MTMPNTPSGAAGGSPDDDVRGTGTPSGPESTAPGRPVDTAGASSEGAPAPGERPAAGEHVAGPPPTGTPAPGTPAPEPGTAGRRPAGQAVPGAGPSDADASHAAPGAPATDPGRAPAPGHAPPAEDAPAATGAETGRTAGAPPEEPTAHRGADRLLDAATADGFRHRLRGIQSDFVDDPGAAVRGADDLAAEIVNAVGQALADRKRALEEAAAVHGGTAADTAPDTASGPESDTERLRLALHGYRDFVTHLLGL